MPDSMSTRPERGPTIYDVARLAGVSHQTVSRVVNDVVGVRPAVRARVRQAIAMLGYRRSVAAADLAGARRHTVAVIAFDATNPTSVEAFIGVHAAAIRAERPTVGSMTDPSDDIARRAALNAVLGHRPSSMIVVFVEPVSTAVVRAFAHRHSVPTVLVGIGSALPDELVGSVVLKPKGLGRSVSSAVALRALGTAALEEAIRYADGAVPRARLVDSTVANVQPNVRQ